MMFEKSAKDFIEGNILCFFTGFGKPKNKKEIKLANAVLDVLLEKQISLFSEMYQTKDHTITEKYRRALSDLKHSGIHRYTNILSSKI